VRVENSPDLIQAIKDERLIIFLGEGVSRHLTENIIPLITTSY